MRSLSPGMFALLVVVLSCDIGQTQDANPSPKGNVWLEWRGPTRDGQFYGPAWPANFKNLKEIWSVPLDKSYSGPIVAKNRVFTTETSGGKEEVTYAFDRATGKKLWQTKWTGSMTVPFFAARNGSWIRATPAYDGERLYVSGIRDVLVCLSGKDGKELWRFDFAKEFGAGLPPFGAVCSPLIDGDYLYIQAGNAFVKLDKYKGKVSWKTLQDAGGMMSGGAFSSPSKATIHGKEQILVQTRSKLAGVDPKNGKVFWTQDVPSFRGMNILTPTVYKDGVFTSTYGNKSFFYDINKTGDGLAANLSWTNKLQGYMSSPVIIGDHAYLHLKSQNFACIDLKTGQPTWVSDQRFGQYWSMIARGDKILALDQNGELFLIQANPGKFEILDRKKISNQETWAHIAAAGNEIFVRELDRLVAYRWE